MAKTTVIIRNIYKTDFTFQQDNQILIVDNSNYKKDKLRLQTEKRIAFKGRINEINEILQTVSQEVLELQFIDSSVDKIDLSKFSSLVALSFYGFNLDKTEISNFPKTLISLSIEHCSISNITKFIDNITDLKILGLAHNQIITLDNILHLKDLQYLDIRNNKLNNLPNFILNMSNLKGILVDRKALTEEMKNEFDNRKVIVDVL